MVRSTKHRLLAALLGGALISLSTASVAQAASPPLTGTVSCGLSATSTFTPWLNYSPSPRPGFPNQGTVRPGTSLKWRLDGQLSGCIGTQTGGNPRVPGPIRSGEIVVKGKTVGRQCTTLSAGGMTVKSVKITWFDAAGNRMPTTKGTGSLHVSGLGNGFPPIISVNPIVYAPGYVPPGIVTFTVSATAKSTARAFPGRPLTMTAVADQDLEDMSFPCSYAGSPLETGIPGFSFHGGNGSSTVSVG